MKKTIYECFVRCHITYGIIAWGAKKSNNRTDLITTLKRVWSKIGPRRIHTNERLSNFGIFKLEDEIRIKEVKVIWKWLKNKIPDGLKDIITERNTRNLRNRQFTRDNSWKQSSISYRLATRAMKEIDEICCARSITGLKNKYKKIIKSSYQGACNIRNCYICTRA